MLVSRADPCPSDGEQCRETSCDVAMFCESYCLKDGSQHPETTKPTITKRMASSMVWYISDVAALAEPPKRRITGCELQRGVKLVKPANSDSVEISVAGAFHTLRSLAAGSHRPPVGEAN
jgi:hypothetical protein